MSYKIKKLTVIFEDNEYKYEIPLSKLEMFSSPEIIEGIQKAAVEAIRRM